MTLTAAIMGQVQATQRATSEPHGLVLTGIRDLLAEHDEAVDWIIEDRFAYGSLNLLAGKPKSGKSTIARYLAFCVATGTPFLSHRTTAGPVWYLVLEDKRSEVRRHFRSLGATGAEPIRFLFGSVPDLLIKLATLAEIERPAVIIVDTVQRLLSAKDLNDYAEVTSKLTPVLTLARATGAAIVLVHHAGKGERAGIDTVLGSTALAGSVDNIFLVNRSERYRLLSSIQRIGPDLAETVVTLDGEGHLHIAGSREDADQQHVEGLLLEALDAASVPMTQTDWLGSVEARRQVKLKAFAAIRNRGAVLESGAGTKADPRLYRALLSDSGSVVPLKGWEPESQSSTSLPFSSNCSMDSGSQVPTVPQVPKVHTEPDSARGNDDGDGRF